MILRQFIVHYVLEKSIFSVISEWISGCLFTLDVRDCDTLGKFNSRFVSHVRTQRQETHVAQRRSVISDLNRHYNMKFKVECVRLAEVGRVAKNCTQIRVLIL